MESGWVEGEGDGFDAEANVEAAAEADDLHFEIRGGVDDADEAGGFDFQIHGDDGDGDGGGLGTGTNNETKQHIQNAKTS